MTRDEATVDKIFAGNLDSLPPLSSKVGDCYCQNSLNNLLLSAAALIIEIKHRLLQENHDVVGKFYSQVP